MTPEIQEALEWAENAERFGYDHRKDALAKEVRRLLIAHQKNEEVFNGMVEKLEKARAELAATKEAGAVAIAMIRTANSEKEAAERQSAEWKMAAEAAKEKIAEIMSVVPILFLVSNDAPGSTGPTADLDIVGSIRNMVEAGRRLGNRANQAEARADAAEARVKEQAKAYCETLNALQAKLALAEKVVEAACLMFGNNDEDKWERLDAAIDEYNKKKAALDSAKTGGE